MCGFVREFACYRARGPRAPCADRRVLRRYLLGATRLASQRAAGGRSGFQCLTFPETPFSRPWDLRLTEEGADRTSVGPGGALRPATVAVWPAGKEITMELCSAPSS